MTRADDLYALLRKRYPADQYALLPQVRNGTGFARGPRTADAIAIGLWPSRGLHVHGFEIKVNRADWQRERSQPEKAEEIASRCDFWWLVAPDQKVIPEDEVPGNWGLLIPTPPKGDLRAVKSAEKLDAKQLDRGFIAAVLRKALAVITPDAALEKARKAGYDAGRAEVDALKNDRVRYAEKELEKYRTRVSEFEAASGVRILDRWEPAENIGAAVRAVLAEKDELARSWRTMRANAEKVLELTKDFA